MPELQYIWKPAANVEVLSLRLHLKGDVRKSGIPDEVVQIKIKNPDKEVVFWVVPDTEFGCVTMTIDELKEKYQE